MLSVTILERILKDMALIPAGEFIMGSPEGEGAFDEHPQHVVYLDDYYLDKYEVKNVQFKEFVEANRPMPGGQTKVTHIPTVAREVFDVTGAGDTVVAVSTLALAAGASMLDAARIANCAAGIVVGKVGTASVTTEELREGGLRSKLLSEANTSQAIEI